MLLPIQNFNIAKNFIQRKQNNHLSSAKNNSGNYSMSESISLRENGINTHVAYYDILLNSNPDEISYSEFTKSAKQCGIKSLEDLTANIKEENYIGAGANSKVYKFDDKKLDKWVLKENLQPFYKPVEGIFRISKDDFPSLNLGQEIAQAGDRYSILKKVSGTPHSIENWSAVINGGSKVSREDSLEFLDTLNKIQDFPQASFDKYAADLKTIQEKGYKQDSINPNNLLIDYDNQKIQIIDFFKVADPAHVNSKYDLSGALLDFPLFGFFHENLDEDEQEELVNCANNIIDKCTIASQKAGIKQDEETFLKFLGNVDKWFGAFLIDKGGDYTTRYERMKDILNQ